MGVFDNFINKSKVGITCATDNINNYIVDMCDTICKKCEYGDAMERLNKFERVFYVTQALEMEVNNGGFSQFFYNSSGNLSSELVHAFTEIGAMNTVEICKKALEAFGRDIPIDRDERQDMLEEVESEEIDDILNECDDTFYKYADNLNALNYAYIMKHKEYFN